MNSDQEELVNEMKATRKVIAYLLQKMDAVENKIDNFTKNKEQRHNDELSRLREKTWS